MKLFLTYIRSKTKVWALYLVFAAVFFAAFALYRLPLEAVIYPALLCLLIGTAVVILDFSKVKKRHEALNNLRDITELIGEELPVGNSIEEADLSGIISKLSEENAAQYELSEAKYREMIDYYTVWAHQIKTPIASMKLTLQNEDSQVSRKLSSELFRIEQYVEMVLTYLRLDSESSDYVFKEHDLDTVIRASVRKFAPEFIGRKISLDYKGINKKIITDDKWFSFVIEQVLSNALKYTREGSISIYLKDEKNLCISDTGIGIAKQDLPRIFEKGYTGYNGRDDKSASGIGLYLCRRICKALGIGIGVTSEIGVGTTVEISLKQKQINFE